MNDQSKRGEPQWQQRLLNWVRLLQSADTLQEIEEQFIARTPWRVVAIYKIDEQKNLIHANSLKGYEQLGVVPSGYPLLPENNLISSVFLRGETVVIDKDWEQHGHCYGELFCRVWHELKLEKAAAVPLIHSGVTVGGMLVGGDEGDDFAAVALQSLELIAPMLAFLIVKQDMLETLESENRAFRWIQEMSQILLFVRDEEELWRQFRDMLMQLGHINGGVYAQCVDGVWQVEDVFGPIASYKERLNVDFPKWLLERVTTNWQDNPYIWSNSGVRILPSYVIDEPKNGQGLLAIIGSDRELFAALSIYSVVTDPLLKRLLPTLIQSFTLAFRLIRQRKLLARLSTHDALTGAWNRRGLETHFEQLSAKPVCEPMVMILLDLDYFKELNDREGHDRGDEALIEISRYFLANFKQNDVVARLGGDEFVLLLHKRTWTKETADSLLNLIHGAPLKKYRLSMTLGVVEFPTEGKDFSACYRLADERLYIGKRNGKSAISAPSGLIAL